MTPPVGIYVQVPFCQTKCTYCNFHTSVVSPTRFATYVAALCEEIQNRQRFYADAGIVLPASVTNAKVNTIYLGGGTPSLLDPSQLRAVLDSVRANFATDLAEVTLEADPETVSDKSRAWVVAGINRVSFGVQSFSDRELSAAGRLHRLADVHRAVPLLRQAGIQNINFDLIAGLPHQTHESWRASLKELAGLTPQHVSVYVLEIDEGSRLGAEVLRDGTRYHVAALPTEDHMAEFYEIACEFLGRAGYHHYEISNWAKPGLESRHNLKYWRREPYLGFGAGAHSFSGSERWANAHDAAAYVTAIGKGRLPLEQYELLTSESALEEELFLGLRQLDGIDVSRIERDYGVRLGSRFEPLASAGLVEQAGTVVRLAPEKLSVSNEVFVQLMK